MDALAWTRCCGAQQTNGAGTRTLYHTILLAAQGDGLRPRQQGLKRSLATEGNGQGWGVLLAGAAMPEPPRITGPPCRVPEAIPERAGVGNPRTPSGLYPTCRSCCVAHLHWSSAAGLQRAYAAGSPDVCAGTRPALAPPSPQRRPDIREVIVARPALRLQRAS